MEHRFHGDAQEQEPVPPSLSNQPLFRTDEILLFEDFLDNLATENEFLFHPKIPPTLSWDGFLTSKNQAFDTVKHSSLQFGSDTHFSTTEGYVATHKFVPPGYGHVHPQSSAQRSHRSSASSRTPSRRPSVPPETMIQSPVSLTAHQHGQYRLDQPGSGLHSLASLDYHSLGNNHMNVNQYATTYPTYPVQPTNGGNFGNATQSQPRSSGHSQQFGERSTSNYALPSQPHFETMTITDQYPNFPDIPGTPPAISRLNSKDEISPVVNSFVSRASSESKRSDQNDSATVPRKKIKIEEGAGKQPLSAAQKRQNHISSEQRRRNLIKEGFIDLSAIVPNVASNASKSTILHEAIDFIKANSVRNQELREKIRELKQNTTGMS